MSRPTSAVTPSPGPAEAAAIAAAIERFQAETSPVAGEDGQRAGAWQRAALLEGVSAKAAVQDLRGEGGSKWLS